MMGNKMETIVAMMNNIQVCLQCLHIGQDSICNKDKSFPSGFDWTVVVVFLYRGVISMSFKQDGCDELMLNPSFDLANTPYGVVP